MSGLLFVACSVLSFILAIAGWDGPNQAEPEVTIALVGFAFADLADPTTNLDYTIVTTMIVAGTTLLLAVLQMVRLPFARFVLAIIGTLLSIYYVFALIDALTSDFPMEDFIALVIVALVLWVAATVVVVLPATANAMNQHKR
ncbi:hypothetical protein [Phytoactinopolyspora halotolerans]|uniref:Uncharacterized protein n=1 Tax=Phytoactinopolyspora halotolerans TaxID=1981512 RepID=A0A6L9SC47_9ACTN|nr:hypothetical protein [Phytoactinopolyspora halotolerans]NEE02653.1 hypothetical protein [Phytoactinopolyspora halotolerans]